MTALMGYYCNDVWRFLLANQMTVLWDVVILSLLEFKTSQSVKNNIPTKHYNRNFLFLNIFENTQFGEWQRGVIKLAKGSKRPQWDLKPGSLD